MCENCQATEKEKRFQDGYDKSILCEECFYLLFKEIIPGLKIPESILLKEELDFDDKILIEYNPFKQKSNKKFILNDNLDGKWAKRFIG